MNKPVLTLFAISCLLLVPLMMQYRMSVKAELVTLYVDDDNITGPWNGTNANPYQNITNALEHATNGDTIFVRTGTYYENVVINKSISLVGENRDLTIVDADGNGTVILIEGTNEVDIKGFTVQRSGPDFRDSGIYIDQSSGNEISDNNLTSNYNGISFYSSGGNVVSGNTITSNYNGISFYSSNNNVVSRNKITSNNNDGIGFYFDSSSNVVSRNTITDNDDGIGFYFDSSSNVVSGNTITCNDEGMYLASDSTNNTVYCNNFNNTNQVCSESTNIWDFGDTGNWWSNYTGVDKKSGPHQNVTGSDGIGDDPHFINVNNQDNYPLMGMFSDLEIALESATYHVITVCNSTISDFRFEIGPETGGKIMRFNVVGNDNAVGFCRVGIPTELMNYSLIVMVGVEEIDPKVLSDVSNETYTYLYFTYAHGNHTITVTSSKTLYLYRELLDKYSMLQTDLNNLSSLYVELVNKFAVVLGNYSQLKESYQELNLSYVELVNKFAVVLGNYSQLKESYQELNLDLYNLNSSYVELVNKFAVVLGNYSQLKESYQELNDSYQEHLSDYSQNACNIRNLIYIFAATTAIFIVTTVYLSKNAHAGKTEVFEETQK